MREQVPLDRLFRLTLTRAGALWHAAKIRASLLQPASRAGTPSALTGWRGAKKIVKQMFHLRPMAPQKNYSHAILHHLFFAVSPSGRRR